MRLRDLVIGGAVAVAVVAGLAILLIRPASDADEIADTFQRYQEAVAEEDVETICNDLMFLAEASAAHCEQALARAVGRPDFQEVEELELGEPRIEDGSYAKARTAPNRGFFEFRQEDGQWKIVFLR